MDSLRLLVVNLWLRFAVYAAELQSFSILIEPPAINRPLKQPIAADEEHNNFDCAHFEQHASSILFHRISIFIEQWSQ